MYLTRIRSCFTHWDVFCQVTSKTTQTPVKVLWISIFRVTGKCKKKHAVQWNSSMLTYLEASSLSVVSCKVKEILKGSLDSIPSPSPSVKIQIIGGKICLRCEGKILPGIVNKLLKTKSFLTSPSNVFPYYFRNSQVSIKRASSLNSIQYC